MLVDTINIIKEYLPVGDTFTYEKIKTFVSGAESELAKVIGKTFYDQLDAHVPTTPPGITDLLIDKFQDSICYTAYYLGFDIINANFSNQGIHRIEDEAKGKRALFQRQEVELKNTFKRTGYNKLDDALAFLEENKSSFSTWTSSPEYTMNRSHFINTTSDFHSYFNINNSRLVFLKLRPYQTFAEDFDVIAAIGRDYFDELKTQIAADTLTAANITFVNRLKKAVAQLTIYHGGYSLLSDMNEFGLYTVEHASNTDNFVKQTQLKELFFDKIISAAKINGDAYLNACKKFLKENIADYPTYANSDAYDADATTDRPTGTNKIVII